MNGFEIFGRQYLNGIFKKYKRSAFKDIKDFFMQHKALDKSIDHWVHILEVSLSQDCQVFGKLFFMIDGDNCDLCKINYNYKNIRCGKCIIKQKTGGEVKCINTPYYRIQHAFKYPCQFNYYKIIQLITKEIKFLLDLQGEPVLWRNDA